MADGVTLFLCGDVMTGRGVDQILPHPGNARLREPYVHDARHYLYAVESAHGPIPRPVPFSWPWGDSLPVLEGIAPQVRVINLECGTTDSEDFASTKNVHYRMHPRNLGAVSAAKPDVCVLANNHVLDFGHRGLADTLRLLAAAGHCGVGAGGDAAAAARPAVLPLDDGTRVLVFSYGVASSGIPASWAAAPGRAGVNFLPDLSEDTTDAVTDCLQATTRPGDLVVVSLHWGANWVDELPTQQVRFAHALIDAGADVVHGHSCHHPLPIEIYRDRLILYGCGDFIDDYEGIPGSREYGQHLRVMYFPTLRRGSGELADMRIVPMRPDRMRLRHASESDSRWLQGFFDGQQQLGDRVHIDTGGTSGH
jgi:poly-gamma-glutamate synthesis protein (capsule biosynthesis protein)